MALQSPRRALARHFRIYRVSRSSAVITTCLANYRFTARISTECSTLFPAGMSGKYGIMGWRGEFGTGLPAWCVGSRQDASKTSKAGRNGEVGFPSLSAGANRLGVAVSGRMGRAFSPPVHGGTHSWGVAPGWDGAARWALGGRILGRRGLGWGFCRGSGETSGDTCYTLAGALGITSDLEAGECLPGGVLVCEDAEEDAGGEREGEHPLGRGEFKGFVAPFVEALTHLHPVGGGAGLRGPTESGAGGALE